jgi:hypothetical protein
MKRLATIGAELHKHRAEANGLDSTARASAEIGHEGARLAAADSLHASDQNDRGITNGRSIRSVCECGIEAPGETNACLLQLLLDDGFIRVEVLRANRDICHSGITGRAVQDATPRANRFRNRKGLVGPITRQGGGPRRFYLRRNGRQKIGGGSQHIRTDPILNKNGHVTAAPPRSVMNSRRCILPPVKAPRPTP